MCEQTGHLNMLVKTGTKHSLLDLVDEDELGDELVGGNEFVC